MFRSWTALREAAIELALVQLPGREARFGEPPCADVLEACRAVGDAMRDDLDEPFALFGHSLGGLLAFELARCLRREMRVTPRLLVVAAHRAPHLRSPRAPIAELPDAEFLDALTARMHGRSPIPTRHPGLMRLLLQTTKADYRMAERYELVDEPPLDCAISVFGGADDPHVTHDELEAWRRHTSSTFAHWTLPGDHFFVDTASDSVCSHMLKDLDQASRRAM